MIAAVVCENYPGEDRVSLIPASIKPLKKAGLEIIVETGAGTKAGFLDSQYEEAGAKIVASRKEAFEQAEIIFQVRSLGANAEQGAVDLDLVKPGQFIIGSCDPLGNPQAIQQMAEKGAIQFALEMIPRITRAQSMDVLSSQATIAGYRAVLLAAAQLPKMFPLMMTAAGTLKPAKVFVVGAGVAGLQAIATAKRLGAVVQAYDVRPVVKEQCESLGAKFVELALENEGAEDKGGYAKQQGEEYYQKQRELMADVVAESDVVITTAAIPGRPSPLLVIEDGVRRMAPGSVIVDLAAERGGNVEPSVADETVTVHNVTIMGPTNLPAEIPNHASQMLSGNITKFLLNMVKDGAIDLNLEDEIIAGTLVANEGQVTNARIRDILGLEPLAVPEEPAEEKAAEPEESSDSKIPFDEDNASSEPKESDSATEGEKNND
ncbi:MAG: Re/Si-specific NAD(P)(+) transhydrogenase subunit alpha [Pirellulales bacterium]